MTRPVYKFARTAAPPKNTAAPIPPVWKAAPAVLVEVRVLVRVEVSEAPVLVDVTEPGVAVANEAVTAETWEMSEDWIDKRLF